ncbi:MAG: cardiolipin synthase [Phycisphaerales bacterium]|nr:cardiolipin synthase [Phycisphaerales bacterium]
MATGSSLSPETLFWWAVLGGGASWGLWGMLVELVVRLLLACAIVIRKGSRPAVATAWIFVVLAFPLIGVIAYLLVGESHLGARRRRLHKEIVAAFDKPQYHRHDDPRAHEMALDPSDMQVATIAGRISHSVQLAGNQARLLGDATRSADAMISDIALAKSSVHMTTYIWLDDRIGEAFAQALMDAVSRGVACRVLVDDHGSARFLRSRQCRQMRARGVRVVAALPTHYLRALFHRIDVRNHRKLMVVDGHIGWLGSMNIAAAEFAIQPRFAPWVDCMVRLDGPVARELQLLFAEDWYLDTSESLEPLLREQPTFHSDGVCAQILASGPNYDNDAVRRLLLAAIQVARTEIVLTTPYFVPDMDMISAICVAAQRGVGVRVVVPRRNNSRLVALASRGRYETLLRAGVSIHEYTRGLLHAKTITVDGQFAIVTSSNLDRRSFDINFECSAILYNDAFTSEVRRLQQSYIDASVSVSLDAWTDLPILTRFKLNVAALISPLI